MSKLDSLYGVVFEGESYYIEFALDDDEFSDDLVEYMKSYVF